MLGRHLLLLVGVFACSTAAIFIKLSETSGVFLAGFRLLIASALLAPLVLRTHFTRSRFTKADFKLAIIPGFVLGFHFITWNWGLRMTEVVNASLIVNFVPIVMPFLLFLMLREVMTRGEIIGTAVAVLGLAVLMVADFHYSLQYFKGDAMCFFSMLLFGLYLTYGRKNKMRRSLWFYMVPIYFIGGLFCVGVGLVGMLTGTVNLTVGETTFAREAMFMLALGVIPTVVGHSILNHSLQTISGQTVAIINLGQFVFAGILGYFILGETPSNASFVAAVLVVAGAVVAIRSTPAPEVELEAKESAA